MAESKKAGIIYTSKNKETGMYYIGATTKSLRDRKQDHINKSNNESDLLFHQAIATYGIEAFEWQETDTASSLNELAEKEKAYISKFNAKEDGYNKDSGGGFNKKVYQYSKENGSLIGTYNSLIEAGNVVNSTKQQISRACLNINNSHKGYFWSYKCVKRFKSKKDARKKKVIYYNFENETIEEFQSVADASNAIGVSKSCIAKFCRGERKPPDNVLWEYI